MDSVTRWLDRRLWQPRADALSRGIARGLSISVFVLTLAIVTRTSVAQTIIPPDVEEGGVAAERSSPNFFIVNDNSISYHYEFTATNPGAGVTGKHVISLSHFDVWRYGTNFINVDWLRATNGTTTPASPCGFPNPNTGCPGYTEWYGLVRSTLAWNKIFSTQTFNIGPLTDVSFLVGADLNTDNTTLQSRKRSIEGGIQFSLATPYEGFLNAGFVAYKEWQNDQIAATLGTNPSGNVNFDTTWGIEIQYNQPLGFLPKNIPLTYNALITLHGPKGAGEPGAPPRVMETYLQQTLSLDLGQVIAGKPRFVSLWAGFRWWENKFGLNPSTSGLCCTTESTWMIGTTFKL
ncbi:MAG TPA: hypothetical protein VN702_03950 [Acetobacteraceae bacterium]|nr:hypothetical protein [Acetobacteraceae bacterium]